jgi:transcriptional regulator with GAF, ATPase, and Fis domain
VSTDRERDVIASFLTLATSLADGFDVVDLLTGLTDDCARLLNIASAGLLLVDGRGALQLLAASSDEAHTLELFQLQRAEGPCLDCYHTGAPVSVADLTKETARWPNFVAAATSAGFASVHALPMRLRDTVLGALNLFSTQVGPLTDDDLALAQALAHVASVALVQDKAAADKDLIVGQLNTALSSRVVIEQSKGVLAQKGGLDMNQAFAALRRYSRDHNERLSDVAAAVVGQTIPPQQILDHAASKSPAQGASVRTPPPTTVASERPSP